jgi:predicted TIM-barrel fold metal-dependent hydrolase
VGIHNILWGNDYPHIEGTWPYSEAVTGRLMQGLTRAERAQIVGLNAARLFNIDVPPQYRATS